MRILIVSAHFLPAAPMAPAQTAGALRAAGHDVTVFDAATTENPLSDIDTVMVECRPEVVCIWLRLAAGRTPGGVPLDLFPPMDHKELVHDLVDRIRTHADARIVLGGSGFNAHPTQWLSELDLTFGLIGETEKSVVTCMDTLAAGGDITRIPGAVGVINSTRFENERPRILDLDELPDPAYDLFDMDTYCELGIAAALETKRGCGAQCIFCPYPSLAGIRERLKNPSRVVDSIERLKHPIRPTLVEFVDPYFNAPHDHAEAILKEIVNRKLIIRWETHHLKPLHITDDFCRLMNESGCRRVTVSVASGNNRMLAILGRRYRVSDVQSSLEALVRHKIPTDISLVFGAPGETIDSITETLDVIDQYDSSGQVHISLGIRLWHERQEIVGIAKQQGTQLNADDLFKGSAYLSPNIREEEVRALIRTMSERPRYRVDAALPFDSYSSTMESSEHLRSWGRRQTSLSL